MKICLRDGMQSAQGWGRIQGALVSSALQSSVGTCLTSVIQISLQGIEHMDVSFAGEIVRLISYERMRRGYCLVDGSDVDLLANWSAAASAHMQPLFAWDEDMRCCLLGPEPNSGLRDILRYVLSVRVTRTCDAASTLHLTAQNASNKLKQLWMNGYILRREQNAGTGGKEYEYFRIA